MSKYHASIEKALKCSSHRMLRWIRHAAQPIFWADIALYA